MKKNILITAICIICTQAYSQWNITGNAGTNASTNFVGTTDNIAFKIRTNNAVRMTINGNGKVGIGITSPVGKLHVKGNTDVSQLMIDATATQTNANPLIKLRKSDGTDLMWIHSDNVNNTFIGKNAGQANNAIGGGLYNTFIGTSAGSANTTGYSNTAVGIEALPFNTTGYENTSSGSNALWLNTTASQNTAIGSFSLLSQSFNNGGIAWVSANTAVGFDALRSNQPVSTVTGIYNTAVGHSTLRNNTTGESNTAIGVSALYSNLTGNSNTASGFIALFANTTGTSNTANGYGALRYNNGDNNTANGRNALFYNTAGSFNTANGMNALLTNNTGNYNTASGVNALYTNSAGSNNTATGVNTLYSSTGENNTASGNYALVTNTTGSNNTAHGMYTLTNNTTGSLNTALGYAAGVTFNNSTNATAIGARAYVSTSNALVLGSVNGINGATSNVNVGIGTDAPGYALDVRGNTGATGNFNNTALTVDNLGVYGRCYNTPYYGYGLYGEGGYVGVYGRASLSGTGVRYGVLAYGENGASFNYGVRGFGTGGSQAFGVYGSASGGTTNYGVYGSAPGVSNYAGFFSGDVYASGVYFGSDRKLKEDIKPLNNALEIINQLKPSVYNFKTEEYKQMNLPGGLRYGLIADEVQKVLPQILKKTVQPAEYENHDEKNGKKLSEAVEFNALNYTEIIPILIGGMKEQQKQIEKSEVRSQILEEENEKLKNEIAEIKAALGLQSKSSDFKPLTSGTLEQNSPNPFHSQTEIKFTLPSAFSLAQLIITDANGKQVRSFDLQNSSSIIIKASELSAGMYSYSLIIDGVNVETKQMILTK